MSINKALRGLKPLEAFFLSALKRRGFQTYQGFVMNFNEYSIDKLSDTKKDVAQLLTFLETPGAATNILLDTASVLLAPFLEKEISINSCEILEEFCLEINQRIDEAIAFKLNSMI